MVTTAQRRKYLKGKVKVQSGIYKGIGRVTKERVTVSRGYGGSSKTSSQQLTSTQERAIETAQTTKARQVLGNIVRRYQRQKYNPLTKRYETEIVFVSPTGKKYTVPKTGITFTARQKFGGKSTLEQQSPTITKARQERLQKSFEERIKSTLSKQQLKDIQERAKQLTISKTTTRLGLGSLPSQSNIKTLMSTGGYPLGSKGSIEWKRLSIPDRRKIVLRTLGVRAKKIKPSVSKRVTTYLKQIPKNLGKGIMNIYNAGKISSNQLTKTLSSLKNINEVRKSLQTLKKDKSKITKYNIQKIDNRIKDIKQKNIELKKSNKEIKTLLTAQETRLVTELAALTVLSVGAGAIGGLTSVIVNLAIEGSFSYQAGYSVAKAVDKPTVENITEAVIISIPTALGIWGSIKTARTVKINKSKINTMIKDYTKRVESNQNLLKVLRKQKNKAAIRQIVTEIKALNQAIKELRWTKLNLFKKSVSKQSFSNKIKKSYKSGVHSKSGQVKLKTLRSTARRRRLKEIRRQANLEESKIRNLKSSRAIQLEKERRLLRKQQALERKIRQGKRIKAVKGLEKTSKGYYFEDVNTGKFRYFQSRKKWLSAVKQQAKQQAKEPKILKLKSSRAIQLEKERRLLRKQQALERKIRQGKRIKAVKGLEKTSKGYPFEDVKTGKVRYFQSRKNWLSAVKQQVKPKSSSADILINNLKEIRNKWSKELKKPKSIDNRIKNYENYLKGIKKLKQKSKEVKNIIKKSKYPTPKERQNTLKKIAQQEKSLERVGTQTQKSGQKQLLKQVDKIKNKIKQEEANIKKLDKKIVTEKTKLRTQQLLKILERDSLKLKLIISQTRRLKLRAIPILKSLQSTIQKQKSKLKVIQKQKTKTKQKIKAKLTTRQVQRLKVAQVQKVGQLTKTAQKLLNDNVYLYNQVQINTALKKIKMPFKIKINREKYKSLVKKGLKIKKPKNMYKYFMDLYSYLYGVKASAKERKALLRKGRIFTGTEIRKII